MELYWSYTGVEKWFKRLRIYLPVWLCGGGVARPLAAVGRRTGQVSGRAERGVAGVFGFGSLRWICGREEVKAKSPATGRGGERWNVWSLFFWLCVLDMWEGRGQRNKPRHRGTAGTKIPKITKIPIIVDVFREPNDSRNTSREQVYTQTAKKYVMLYSIVNVS